ncbi:MAG: histidine kinase [Saprospiraceae bacterium]
MKYKNYLFYGCILLFSSTLSAQVPKLSFRSIGLEEGLDERYHTFLKKDTKGILWISSTNGLFSYDGQLLKKYVTQTNAPNGMRDNNIQSSFFEDQQGDLWFTSLTGINIYHRQSDHFSNFQLKDEQDQTLNSDYHIFAFTNQRLLWLRIDTAIYTYDLESKVSQKRIDSKGIYFHAQLDPQQKVQYVFSCPFFRQSGFELITCLPDGTLEKTVFWKEGYQDKFIEIRNVLPINDQSVYFFADRGIVFFDLTKKTPVLIPAPAAANDGFISGSFLDADNLLLTSSSGLWIYTISTAKFSRYLPAEKSLRQTSIAVYSDYEEQIWLALKDENDLYTAWNKSNPFQQNISPKLSESQVVSSIAEDHLGNIWQLTAKRTLEIYTPTGSYLNSASSDFGDQSITKIKQLTASPQGDIFILRGHQIFQYLVPQKKWQLVYQSKINKIIFFKAISKSRIVLMQQNEQLLLLQKDSNAQWSTQTFPSPVIEPLSSTRFFIPNNNLLLLPIGQNLELYALQKDTTYLLQRISIDFEISSIAASSTTKKYWLGTNQGLKQLQYKQDQSVLQHDLVEATSTIRNVLEDRAGLVWFTTAQNLHCFNPELGTQTSFSMLDQLPTKAFQLYAAQQSRDGKLWFGTNQGSISFDPVTTKVYPFLPKVQLKNLQLNNIPFLTTFELAHRKNLELAHEQNNLSFEVQVIGTYLPQHTKLYYRLLNYDTLWKAIEPTEKIRFNQLQAGDYQLEYYSLNVNQQKTKTQQLAITIHPPFWQTWWFYLSSTLALIGIVFLFAKLYVRQKLKVQARQLAQQLALQAERNRIAGELHDDLGSGLSTIKFLSEDLSQLPTQQNQKKRRKNIARINQSARELLEKMSDIIWAMNTDNDHLEDLLLYLYQYADEYLSTHQITCHIQLPATIPSIPLRSEKRRNILLVLKEIFHNVVKHSQASIVHFDIELTDQHLKLKVHDNGIGFIPDASTSTGNGIPNIQRRTAAINGKIQWHLQEGTLIVLIIPLVPTKQKL